MDHFSSLLRGTFKIDSLTAEERLLYEQELREVRRRLRKDWNVYGQTGKQRAATQRAITELTRKHKTYEGQDRPQGREDIVKRLRDIRSSQLMDSLFPERNQPGVWKRLNERLSSGRTVPQEIDLNQFSFLDEPVKTMQGLRTIAEAEARQHSAKINFNDEFCMDVVPFMLLVECWQELLPIFQGGAMDHPMQKVLAAIGVEYALGISLQGVDDFDNVWAFPLNRRRRAGETRSRKPYIDVPTRDIAADRFCDAIDEWLRRPEIGLQLTKKGLGWIKQLLGELLENAERHSDGVRHDGSWAVSGFLARRELDGRDAFVAQLGIVSLGDTFTESLARALPEQKDGISRYIAGMRNLGCPQSDEALTTLAALQDGVTCFAEADKDNRGGMGLMDMLDLVNMLGTAWNPEHKSCVTIISGSACIKLSGQYIRGKVHDEDAGTRVQWFNSENSAKIPPDPNHVFDLPHRLPGTAISIRFTLEPKALKAVVNNGKENNDD